MTLLRIGDLPDELVAPVLIVAFDGWVDAAGASSGAAEFLADGAARIVTFDDDILFDYRSRRPTLDIIDGTLHRLQWPALQIDHRTIDGRDLLILHGPEPDFRWKQLADAIGSFCVRVGVLQWISLGAIPAAVAHTRPVPILANASRDGLLHEAESKGPPGLLRVPSAALSSIELPIADMGIPTVGFYAQVPHYIGGPYAAASASLLRHVGRHLGVDLDVTALEDEAAAQRQRLDAAVAADDDVREILARLEQTDEEVPSGDELAAEIERFLRGQAE
jgi:hypothetical protein